MNLKELRDYVDENPRLVTKRESESHRGLFVLKYHRRVFYDGLWNDFLEECRGTVVDRDFNLVTYPFTKVYNYGIESRSPKMAPDTMVTAFRKINGFMVSMTWHRNDLLISTTGSLESPFIVFALNMMGNSQKYREVCERYRDYTLMFECVCPSDPHIIPEEKGMYLLGMRKKELNSPMVFDPELLNSLSEEMKTKHVESMRIRLDELQQLVKLVKHEGFVFYTDEGVSSKIKSPYYLISKFVSRNPKTEKLMKPGVKKTIDEEYYPLISHIQENIAHFTSLSEQDRLVFVREFLSATNLH